jgi:hypothetical protein
MAQDETMTGHSLFAADRWQGASPLSVDAGLRWDRMTFRAAPGEVGQRTEHALSPRILVSWKPAEHSLWLVSGGVARHVDVTGSPPGASFASGSPEQFFLYDGPALNGGAGPDATDEVIQRALEWFVGAGGLGRTPLVLDRPESLAAGSGLLQTTHWTLGVDRQLGMESFARASVFHRTVSAEIPGVDRVDRRLTGITFQARYRVGIRAHAGATYTLAKVSTDDVEAGRVGVPYDPLTGDVRHRLRLWGRGQVLVSESLGLVTAALLYSIDSGESFGAVGLVDVGPDTVATYAFTSADAFRAEGLSRTDLAINWSRGVPGTVYGRLFVQFHVLNLLGSVRPIDPAAGVVVLTAATDPRFARFDPQAEAPLRGVHWDLAERWRDGVPRAAATMPRTIRLSLGVRF